LAASRDRQTKEVLCDGQLQFPLGARVSWKLGQLEERVARGCLPRRQFNGPIYGLTRYRSFLNHVTVCPPPCG
jgi:hypothetical protein